MKKELLICMLAFGLVGAAGAEPAAELVEAAKKLAASKNYAWSTSMSWGERDPRVTSGKKGSGGHVHVSYPMRDDTVDILMRSGKVAVKGEGGWELVSSAEEGDENRRLRFIARMAENFAEPTAQALEMVGKLGEVTAEEGTYNAVLSEEAAKELMSFRGRGRGGRGGGEGNQPPEIMGASGKVTFTVADGVLTKYVMTLSGTMNWGGEDRDIGRTTTVEFSDVGSTSFDIPEEAAGLLAGS